jgi:Domain of unknown function (DUF4386)
MSALSSPVEPSTTSASVFSDGPRFRRIVAGVSLVLSPVFLLAAFVVVPTMASDTRAMLAAIAQHPTQWYLFGLFLLVSYVLLAPAVLGLMHLLRDRAAAWSGIGGSLALLGTISAVTDTRLVFVTWQMAAPEADRDQMVALLTRLEASAGATLPFILGTLGLVIGTVLLAIGLYRARTVPTWVAAALGAGIVANLAAFIAGSRPGLIASSAILVLAYGYVGLVFLRQSDQDWEHRAGAPAPAERPS